MAARNIRTMLTPKAPQLADYEAAADDDELVDINEAARLLNVSVKTMRNWKTKHEGPPFVKLGHSLRYRKGDLRRWVHERTQA